MQENKEIRDAAKAIDTAAEHTYQYNLRREQAMLAQMHEIVQEKTVMITETARIGGGNSLTTPDYYQVSALTDSIAALSLLLQAQTRSISTHNGMAMEAETIYSLNKAQGVIENRNTRTQDLHKNYKESKLILNMLNRIDSTQAQINVQKLDAKSRELKGLT